MANSFFLTFRFLGIVSIAAAVALALVPPTHWIIFIAPHFQLAVRVMLIFTVTLQVATRVALILAFLVRPISLTLISPRLRYHFELAFLRIVTKNKFLESPAFVHAIIVQILRQPRRLTTRHVVHNFSTKILHYTRRIIATVESRPKLVLDIPRIFLSFHSVLVQAVEKRVINVVTLGETVRVLERAVDAFLD